MINRRRDQIQMMYRPIHSIRPPTLYLSNIDEFSKQLPLVMLCIIRHITRFFFTNFSVYDQKFKIHGTCVYKR